MLKLSSEILSAETAKYLTSQQKLVDSKPNFESKVKTASSKWDGKTGSAKGKACFSEIKSLLKKMCIGVELCMYCEQNEATDIEHIYPKRLYPGKSFTWENYTLACSKCNTHHKLDNFKIFSPAGSSKELDIKPKKGVYAAPKNADALFLNQRTENPMDYLELDLVNRMFIFTERFPEGTREFIKAKYTKDLLGLNAREALVANRKSAAMFFIARLEIYVHVKKSRNFKQLKSAIKDDFNGIDTTGIFKTKKNEVLENVKKDILSYGHQTVWRELIRQKELLPKTNELLKTAPEAEGWIK